MVGEGGSLGERRELGLVKRVLRRVLRRGLLGEGRAERRGDVCVWEWLFQDRNFDWETTTLVKKKEIVAKVRIVALGHPADELARIKLQALLILSKLPCASTPTPQSTSASSPDPHPSS